MNRLIRTMFDNREYTRDYLLDINNPEHGLMLDIDVLCERLHDIFISHRNIVVLPDFDTDGIMSGVIGFAGLAELGFSVSLFIPDPKDGYGFTADTIDRLVREYPSVNAVLTCDVGTSCFEGIARGKTLGLEMLITDHHIQSQIASEADVIVNPMRIDDTYEHPLICGAYVLYQVLQRYSELYCNAFLQEQIRRLCVFAGIGTVSDIMPLLYENRKLVRDSVSVSRMIYADGDDIIVNYIAGCDVYRRAFYGLFQLYKTFADKGILSHGRDITESFYAYYIAPMFNSTKRMEGDMKRPFGVFFGADSESDCDYLIQLNNQRKQTVAKYMTELEQRPQPHAPYLYISDAPKGILGLLANKLQEKTGLPVMVVNHEGKKFTGSGRSPEWYLFLDRVSAEGFYVAGHNSAFGIGITDSKELKSVLAFLDKDIQDTLAGTDMSESKFQPDFVIANDGSGDTTVDIDLFRSYLSELELYRPFGKAFPAPQIVLKFSAAESEWRAIGNMKQHLKIILPYGFEVLCWNQASMISEKDNRSEFCVLGSLSLNEFNGSSRVQFTGSLTDDI